MISSEVIFFFSSERSRDVGRFERISLLRGFRCGLVRVCDEVLFVVLVNEWWVKE